MFKHKIPKPTYPLYMYINKQRVHVHAAAAAITTCATQDYLSL